MKTLSNQNDPAILPCDIGKCLASIGESEIINSTAVVLGKHFEANIFEARMRPEREDKYF